MPTPSEIQTCIDNLNSSSAAFDFVLLAAETGNANTGISFSVATESDLPDIPSSGVSTGQVVFVESLGVPVISTLDGWSGLDGRILSGATNIKALYVWGRDTVGELGLGTCNFYCYTPTRDATFSNNWSFVAAGKSHSVGIKETGELFEWGGPYLSLGASCAYSNNAVREASSSTNWCYAAAEGDHKAAIKTDGSLWTWGFDNCGEFGYGKVGFLTYSPAQEICSATDWCQVSMANCNATMAVKTDGTLWGWGAGVIMPIACQFSNVCSPVQEVCCATDWTSVCLGSLCHGMGLKSSGQIWTWGYSTCGGVGDGLTPFFNRCSPVREFCSATDWCQISTGYQNSFAIKTDGSVWGWGSNYRCALGVGTGIGSTCSPVREFCSATNWCCISATGDSGASVIALKTDGTLWGWGCANAVPDNNGSFDRCSPVQEYNGSTDWCTIATGRFHAMGIRVRCLTS